jgi:hypothetical protein
MTLFPSILFVAFASWLTLRSWSSSPAVIDEPFDIDDWIANMNIDETWDYISKLHDVRAESDKFTKLRSTHEADADRVFIYMLGASGVGKSSIIGALAGQSLGSSGFYHDTVDIKAYEIKLKLAIKPDLQMASDKVLDKKLSPRHRATDLHLGLNLVDTRGIMDISYGLFDLYYALYDEQRRAVYPGKVAVVLRAGDRLVHDEIRLLRQLHTLTDGFGLVILTFCVEHGGTSPATLERDFTEYAQQSLQLAFHNVVCANQKSSSVIDAKRKLIVGMLLSPPIQVSDFVKAEFWGTVLSQYEAILNKFDLSYVVGVDPFRKVAAVLIAVFGAVKAVVKATKLIMSLRRR